MHHRALTDRVSRWLTDLNRRINELDRAATPVRPPREVVSRPVRQPERRAVRSQEEEARPRRQPPAETAPQVPAGKRPAWSAALSTRSGLRRAIVMQEILGPPKGLRGTERPDGNRTPMDGV